MPGRSDVMTTPNGQAARRDDISRARLEALVRSSADAIVGATLDGVITDWNPAAERLYGYSAEEVIGQRTGRLIPREHAAEAEAILARVLRGESVDVETVRFARDGQRREVSITVFPIWNDAGEIVATSAIVRDITAQNAAAGALAASETRFRLAFENAPIGMALVGADERTVQVNRALCAMLGYSEAELLGTTLRALTHPDDIAANAALVERAQAGELEQYALEKRYLRKDGRVLWALLTTSFVRDAAGAPLYFISQIQDISERRQLEEQLMFLAGHDEMTGLLNRRRFREELERGVAYAHRYRHSGALLLLDLDNFKEVNDTLGHHVGDILVTEVAGRLRERLRATDVLARVGGDEFAVFLPQATPAQAQRVAGELVEHIAGQPFLTDEATVETRASLGVALFEPGEQPSDPEALLMHADLAMYDAKQAGGNRFTVVRAVGRPNPGDSTGSETGLNR